MEVFGPHSVRDRVGSALGAVLVQGLMASLFLWGMGVDMRGAVEAPLRVINVLPPPPPEPKVSRPPPRVESDTENQRFTPDEEGGSSPPNIRSTATEVVAPTPRVPLPVTPPIVAAPVPNVGAAPTQGASVRGPGTGSGGFGDGTGSGAGGGGGGGGGYGRPRPPRLIRGRLRNSDYPEELGIMGVQGTVGVIYTVLADGRVVDCRIERSSGHRILDDMTCNLIERRFFYEPSRDWRGRPITSHIVENHTWAVEEDPYGPPPPPPRRRRLGY